MAGKLHHRSARWPGDRDLQGSPTFFFCFEIPVKTQVHNRTISWSLRTSSEIHTSLTVSRTSVWHRYNENGQNDFV